MQKVFKTRPFFKKNGPSGNNQQDYYVNSCRRKQTTRYTVLQLNNLQHQKQKVGLQTDKQSSNPYLIVSTHINNSTHSLPLYAVTYRIIILREVAKESEYHDT